MTTPRKRLLQAFSTLAILLMIAIVIPSLLTNVPSTQQAFSEQVNYLPGLMYRPGLRQVAMLDSSNSVAMGVGVNPAILDVSVTNANDWKPTVNTVINEYDSITPYSAMYFSSIHPCPPRYLVDDESIYYVDSIYNTIVNSPPGTRCRAEIRYLTELDDTYPTTLDWDIYAQGVEYYWYYLDVAVAWAQLNGKKVEINPIFWEGGDGIQPYWFRAPVNPSGWTNVERHAILKLMEDHVTTVIKRYCTNGNIFYHYSRTGPALTNLPQEAMEPLTSDPEELAVPLHPWNGTSLTGVVSVIHVVNEPNTGTGAVKQENEFSWAIVNDLIDANTDPKHDYYYVYKAYEYARRALNTIPNNVCTGNAKPKLFLNSNFRMDLGITAQDNNPYDNDWARRTSGMIESINDLSSTILIDGIGIQGHFYIKPQSPAPGPGTPTPTAPPVDNDGSTRGLRSIMDFFVNDEEADVEVRITELDVTIRKNGYYDYYTPSDVPPVGTYFAIQSSLYQQAVHQCLYNQLGVFDPICKGITIWGLYDRHAGVDCYYPLPFDQGGAPHSPCKRSDPNPNATATATLTPDPAITPTVTPTIAPIPKAAHRTTFNELLTAPPSPTPAGIYPPPFIPTAVPTPNPYP